DRERYRRVLCRHRATSLARHHSWTLATCWTDWERERQKFRLSPFPPRCRPASDHREKTSHLLLGNWCAVGDSPSSLVWFDGSTDEVLYLPRNSCRGEAGHQASSRSEP